MIPPLYYLCKRSACAIGFALTFALTTAALAQEPIATYPLLPTDTTSTRVFDNKGKFIGRILPEKRYWVPIERIPLFLQNAVVAVEDARFWEHNGIDARGIARALVKDVVKRRMAEGGSTITQQLIKNKYFSGEKTLERKIKEAELAIEFEKKYSKKQILEMYFNEIYYGNGAWGIAQAARLYFDKRPEELTDAECSLLAGVPKAPARYNPLGKGEDVARRRDIVLARMVEMKMISPQQRDNVRAHPAGVMQPGQTAYYLDLVRNKLVEILGPQVIEQGGLDVIAAVDLKLQKAAEQVLRDGVNKISPELQGALICLDTGTGDLLAAVPGTDYTKSTYDRAFVAKRQPGSAIKPLIYAAALDKGITAASIWNDAPVAYSKGNGKFWKPANYEDHGFGNMTLRQALVHSNNVIAVKLLDTIGIPYFTDFATNVGLPLQGQDLTLALGTEEVTLSDLVLAYAPFANGGSRPEPRTIIRIFDRSRGTWTENPPTLRSVVSPATAFVTTQMLKDVLVYGTAKGLKEFSQSCPSAGKTGTTSDYRDAWFIGYTPNIVTGVWVGYDQPRPMGRGFTGGGIAAPIWGRFMRTAVAATPTTDFPKPDIIVSAAIDPTTGYLATPDCTEKREEFYILGSEPTELCPKHKKDQLAPVTPPVPATEPMPAPVPVPVQAPVQNANTPMRETGVGSTQTMDSNI